MPVPKIILFRPFTGRAAHGPQELTVLLQDTEGPREAFDHHVRPAGGDPEPPTRLDVETRPPGVQANDGF